MEISWISRLKNRLEQPLPGKVAHDEMTARLMDGTGVRFNQPEKVRMSAVLILIYPSQHGFTIPLIQRPEYNGVHSRQIALPGGKFETSDPSIIHTALRETHEEIGISPEKIKIIGQLTQFYVGASNYMIQPVVGFLNENPKFILEPREVAEILEAPVDHLMQASTKKETELNVRGITLIAPYFEVKEKIVWGATAMILNEFVTLIKEI